MLINIEFVQQIYTTDTTIEAVLVEPKGCRCLCQLWKAKNKEEKSKLSDMFDSLERELTADVDIVYMDVVEKNLFE